MTSYHTYDVAVMNYPLFNKNCKTEFLQNTIFQDMEIDSFEVPIYIHIPFCDNLCSFCIYNRTLTNQNREMITNYVDALVKEIQMYGQEPAVKKLKIGAVFIGGGTPTVLTENELFKILNALYQVFPAYGCEFTVECNINNAEQAKLKFLKQNGVTRISTGAQTFNDKIRKKMNMSHSGQSVLDWLNNAKNIGFTNVSTDLIYGFPEVGIKEFEQDLKKAVSIELDHISVYKLAVFFYTKLYQDIKSGKIKQTPAKDVLEEIFYTAHEYLIKHDYVLQSAQEYNKNKESAKFWELTYDGYGNNLSFGVSSFGYLNGYCYENEPNIKAYINKIQRGMLPISRISSKITLVQQYERAMLLGFRKGYVSKKMFFEMFHLEIEHVFGKQIQNQIENGLIFEDEKGYGLTPKGLFYQGDVSAQYMISIFENVSSLRKKICVANHEMP